MENSGSTRTGRIMRCSGLRPRRAAITGLIFGLVAIFITWVLMSETSPFYENDLVGTTRDLGSAWRVWGVLNIPAFMALMVSSSIALSVVIIFIQWFLIGYFVSWIFEKLSGVIPKQ